MQTLSPPVSQTVVKEGQAVQLSEQDIHAIADVVDTPWLSPKRKIRILRDILLKYAPAIRRSVANLSRRKQ